MNNKALLVFLGFFFIATISLAQEKLPTQSVYAELGGAGLPFSFNYDFRFDKDRIDSWGMRVGAGGYAIGNESFFSLPVQINKLIGRGPHYFEFGAGATLLAFKNPTYSYCRSGSYDQEGNFTCNDSYTIPGDETNFILDVKGSPNLMGTLNLGYRRVPVDGGFMWRINLSPIFNNNGFWPLWVGVSFGYAF